MRSECIDKAQRREILRLLRAFRVDYDQLSDHLFLQHNIPSVRDIPHDQFQRVCTWIISHRKGSR